MRRAGRRRVPAPPPALIAVALLLVFARASPAGADPAASKNNEGNRLYNQKRYDDALKLYTDAQASRPEGSELHYNIGNVLFRKKEYDKAVEEYLRAQAAANPALSEAATFNRGNALMLQGRPEDAVKAYVQALAQEEKEGIKKHARAASGDRRTPEEDW